MSKDPQERDTEQVSCMTYNALCSNICINLILFQICQLGEKLLYSQVCKKELQVSSKNNFVFSFVCVDCYIFDPYLRYTQNLIQQIIADIMDKSNF